AGERGEDGARRHEGGAEGHDQLLPQTDEPALGRRPRAGADPPLRTHRRGAARSGPGSLARARPAARWRPQEHLIGTAPARLVESDRSPSPYPEVPPRDAST